jgi:hypothetical protein
MASARFTPVPRTCELGRRGGLAPKMTALRRAAAEQDDSLREQARSVLEKAKRGEQVAKPQLDAARSLFSYRATAPAEDRQDFASSIVRTKDGPPVTGLSDVIRYAHELGALSQDVVAACAEVMAAQEAGPAISLASSHCT